MANYRSSGFPSLVLDESEKTPEWCEQVVDAIINTLGGNNSSWESNRYRDIKNYSIYNGNIELDDYKYITEQYGMAYPARLANYPIIQPKIDLLMGEEIRRPVDMKVSTINKEATIRKQDFLVNLTLKKHLNEYFEEVKAQYGDDVRTELENVPMPEDIDQYMRYNYKESVEEMAQDGLDYLMQRYDLKDIFKTGFRDFLVTGKEFYKIYIKNGDPFLRRVDPRSFVYDMNSDSDYLDDAAWAGEERYLTPNEILDEFRDFLTKEDLEFIAKMQNITGYNDYARYNSPINWIEWDKGSEARIRVVHCEWKSTMPVRFKISENKYDPERPFYKLVSKKYRKKKGDRIETKYVDDIWQGTKIGGQIFVDARRRPNQIRSVDDPGSTSLSYVGIVRNNTTGAVSSMVDLLANVQFLYNVVMYHIELALARSGGKAVVYDVSQLPANLGMDMQTVLYHLKTDGIIPINSKDEGGQMSNFNQFQSIDFTLSQSVQQLFNLKLMLEETAGNISGVSRQREGAVGQYEYVGNVQRSVVQSATITEGWFFQHNEVKKKCFEKLCNLMKLSWSQGKKTTLIFGDGGQKLMNILPEISLNDYGVYVGDAGKDEAMRQAITQLSQAALSSGQVSLLDVLRVFKSETMTEAETVLEQGIEAAQKMQQQQAQQQQQVMQMQQQAEAAKFEKEAQLKQIDNEAKIQVAKINAQTDLQVAKIASDDKRDIEDMKAKMSLMDKEKNAAGTNNNDANKFEQIKNKV